MSDMNNDYNYNFNQNNYSDSQDNYSYYSVEPEQDPKPPKKRRALAVVTALLCLGIGVGAGVQVYKSWDESRYFNDDETEREISAKEEADSVKTNNTTAPDKNIADSDTPGLFEIASRADSKYLPDIVDEITPSVVGISSTFIIERTVSTGFNPWSWGFETETQQQESIGTGTGVVMTEDGYIVTNAHVVYAQDTNEYKAGEAKEVSILFSNKEEYEAKIVAYDIETDLAVLKIDASGFTPATFGNSDELRVGELVIAVGNPLGFELFGTVTSGIVSALDREISVNDRKMTLLQTDAAINEGNSGGPLLNSCGQVIGINSVKMSSGYGSASIEGLGFAIPINVAKEIVDDLVNYKHVKGRPQIRISSVDIDDIYSNYLGIPMGVYIRSVAEGSAAEQAGLQIGDVIIGINDEPITTLEELNDVKNEFKAGDTVTLKIDRGGEEINVELMLEENNEMEVSEESTTESYNRRSSQIQQR